MDVQRTFEEHYDPLYRYLVRLSGDSDLAADAAQEAFIRLVERKPDGRQLRAWLFRVATNLVRDGSRVRRRRNELLQAYPDRVPMSDGPGSPEQLLERKEKQKLVRRALQVLSERDRTLLLMREEGFSHQEIAQAVGTTTKSVGSMIARALRKLAVELSQSENEL